MFGIADDSVFSEFEENELQFPCPRKELDGRTIYVSRELRMPRNWGAPVLCDLARPSLVAQSTQKIFSLIFIEPQR